MTSKDATPTKIVEPNIESCKVCGIATLGNARAYISNLKGTSKLERCWEYIVYSNIFN